MTRLRRGAILLAALLAGAACERASGSGSGLVILPPEVPAADPRLYFHDFGHVPDGEVVTHVFRLRNSDPGDVAITRVTPGCGCTVPALRSVAPDGTVTPGEPVASRAEKLLVVPSGHVAEIELRVDTSEMVTKNQDKLILVSVATDSPGSYYQNLELHIYVDQPLVLVPASLQLGEIAASAGGTGSLKIVQAGERRMRVKEIAETPPGVHAVLTPESGPGAEVWELRAGFDPPLEFGPQRAKIVLATEDEAGVAGRPLEVTLAAQAVADLGCEPARLVFAAPRDGPAQAKVELFSRLAGQRLRVLGVEVPAEHREILEASADAEGVDDAAGSPRWSILLATRPPLPEEKILTGTLVVRLDDPQHERFEIPYAVHLR
jgi:hypothetical protein